MRLRLFTEMLNVGISYSLYPTAIFDKLNVGISYSLYPTAIFDKLNVGISYSLYPTAIFDKLNVGISYSLYPTAIFDKLLTLVNAKSLEELTLNSRATYRYLEMLENILDLEESDQVLYKLQVPFFITYFLSFRAFLRPGRFTLSWMYEEVNE